MPAVAAIVRDRDGRILLQQRHDESWSLPAGAIEPGESPGQAVVREVLEETGLAVHPISIAGVVGGPSCRVRYANQDEVEYVVTVFECRAIEESSGTSDPSIGSNDETKRLAYFLPDEMPPLAFQYPSELFERPGDQAYFERPDPVVR